MKKKIIGSVLVLGIVAVAAGLFVPNAVQKITKESVITSSQLEKAVDISELSTADSYTTGSQTSTVMETWKKPSAISRMPPR